MTETPEQRARRLERNSERLRQRHKKRREQGQCVRNWMTVCAEIHTLEPGDGIYVTDRLHVYAGLGRTTDGQLANRWINLCCNCGAQFEWLLTPHDRIGNMIGAGGAKPNWRGPKRCREHANPGVPTSRGFMAEAVDELERRKLTDFIRRDSHYVIRRDPGDTLERLGVTVDRRAELLADLF